MAANEPAPAATRSPAEEVDVIVAEHQAALLRYAGRLLHDPQAAQDVVQEAFIKLARAWRDGGPPAEKIGGWLYRVTHNQAVDYIRKENRLRVLHQDHADEQPPAVAPRQDARMEERDRWNLVLEHVHRLALPEREVLLLRLQEGLSYRDIAATTHRTEGNVGCILHHAVKHMTESLRRAGVS